MYISLQTLATTAVAILLVIAMHVACLLVLSLRMYIGVCLEMTTEVRHDVHHRTT